jgi:hypothetical protein
MKQIIISDTHSPKCIESALSYSKEIIKKIPEIESIIINGDLLGIFSMESSCLHKHGEITDKELEEYLKTAAINFYNKYKQTKTITPEMVQEYVKERYEWCITILKRFTELRQTIFNLGNHESSLHFLVLQELTFLTGCSQQIIAQVDKNILLEIFNNFEKDLYKLEENDNFKYIRNNSFIQNDTLIMGIPGESHSTVGNDSASKKQEEKTKQIIEQVTPMLAKVNSLVIYNHTQGDYDKNTGKFNSASPSLKKFMESLPANVKTKIFIQSHNHWDHTQFMYHNNFYFIMNNAGLHNGIFNMLDFDKDGVTCYDVDPINKKAVKLNLSKEFPQIKSSDDIIARHYPDPEYIKIRKSVHSFLDKLLSS